MPADMVAKANAALNAALSDPAVSSQIQKNGDMVGGGTPERLGTLTRDGFKLWGEVARRNNIRAE
jgi:tripartite-type tricarboxylate transporter receptor subunit TctC